MPTELNRHEKKRFSQFREDGITLEIFSRIGATNCKFVEIGSSEGLECNTLILSHGCSWSGLLIEKEEKQIAIGKRVYSRLLANNAGQVRFVNEFVTAENINGVLADENMQGEIDFLSIDIDGNDYWIWEALHLIKPRVVVIEYNASLGKERAATIRYNPSFVWKEKTPPLFFGASLKALVKLGERKGYSLVTCESTGANAFFILDKFIDIIPKASIKDAFYPRPIWPKDLSEEEQQKLLASLDFIDV